MRDESSGGEDGKHAAKLLQLYVEAVSVHSERNLSNPALTFTLKDYYAIQVKYNAIYNFSHIFMSFSESQTQFSGFFKYFLLHA